ncbi:MAG: CDP-alcohol phosphatidyltransferase family protein [Blastocatellia bacterium]|jgi:phosphatidylglycerophosphate synthase|nr:CDP-alcohol phosphatidyltransferase family protein [Blastocatellia bacterium]
MTPNLITLIRVFLALATIGLFQSGHAGSLVALPLLVVTIGLDAVDGYLARKAKLTTDIGAAFDIAADRIVESVFWIYFAAAGLISFWIPVIVIARGGFTDFLRMIAFTQGQTAFGEKTMLETWWGRMLVGSRWSRAAYGIVKCAAFFALGVWVVLAKAPEWQTLTAGLMTGVRIGALGLAIATVVFCVVRGVPVMIEGARYFRKDLALPKVW